MGSIRRWRLRRDLERHLDLLQALKSIPDPSADLQSAIAELEDLVNKVAGEYTGEIDRSS